MLRVSVKKYFEKHKRLEELFASAKAIFNIKSLPNHNINHAVHVLYRALLIAENDKLEFNLTF